MNKHESGSRLDQAIDRAVRHMMSVEPRPGLRRRVLARIAAPAPGVAWWPRLGFAAAAMAAVVLAIVYMGPYAGPPAPEPVEMLAQAPAPVMPAPPFGSGVAEPPPPEPAVAAPAGASPAPRSERLPDPPRMDNVFGQRPDGRVAAATVDAPAATASAAMEPLPEIEPLAVAPLAATLATEAQDPPPTPAKEKDAKPATGATSQPAVPVRNIRIEVTLTEEGEGAAAPKTVSMLVAEGALGRVRSGVPGAALNVDARPSIMPDGRVRLMLTLDYSAGGTLAKMSQSLTTMLESGKPLAVSQSAEPTSTRRVQAEVTASILK